jgi:hypothetical protein
MEPVLDPILYKDLADAKAALTRHGIVIIRSVETDLEPAMMTAARDSIASSPAVLGEMDEEELDRLMESLRRAAMKSSDDLARLYTRLLAQIGTEDIVELTKELEGIRKLFTWERMAKAADPLNRRLKKAGFDRLEMGGPSCVSEPFRVEFEERWPSAFSRFRDLAKAAAKEIGPPPKPRKPPAKRKGGQSRKKG